MVLRRLWLTWAGTAGRIMYQRHEGRICWRRNGRLRQYLRGHRLRVGGSHFDPRIHARPAPRLPLQQHRLVAQLPRLRARCVVLAAEARQDEAALVGGRRLLLPRPIHVAINLRIEHSLALEVRLLSSVVRDLRVGSAVPRQLAVERGEFFIVESGYVLHVRVQAVEFLPVVIFLVIELLVAVVLCLVDSGLRYMFAFLLLIVNSLSQGAHLLAHHSLRIIGLDLRFLELLCEASLVRLQLGDLDFECSNLLRFQLLGVPTRHQLLLLFLPFSSLLLFSLLPLAVPLLPLIQLLFHFSDGLLLAVEALVDFRQLTAILF